MYPKDLTPEQKANELANKFFRGSVFDYNKESFSAEKAQAKVDALFCVSEIKNIIQGPATNEAWAFWNDVIKEIEKL